MVKKTGEYISIFTPGIPTRIKKICDALGYLEDFPAEGTEKRLEAMEIINRETEELPKAQQEWITKEITLNYLSYRNYGYYGRHSGYNAYMNRPAVRTPGRRYDNNSPPLCGLTSLAASYRDESLRAVFIVHGIEEVLSKIPFEKKPKPGTDSYEAFIAAIKKACETECLPIKRPDVQFQIIEHYDAYRSAYLEEKREADLKPEELKM